MPTENSWPLRQLIVSGEDAASFLQGQLTCDVDTLDGDNLSLAAWCNPKGRTIVLFRVLKTPSGYTLIMPSDLADSVEKRLTMFRFRANVEFSQAGVAAADLGALADQTFDDWFADQIDRGVAWIGAAQSEKYTPHMLNLDLLGAVSFDKGCYTGQEVVARTHYRGATKRRALKFTAGREATPGDRLKLDGRDVGEVINVAGSTMLALVPIDSARAGLTLDDEPVDYQPLPYLALE